MGRTFLSAVFALLMICALAGCMGDGTASHDTRSVTSTDRTALERNGVHDGTTDTGTQDRTMGADWNSYDRYWNGYTTTGPNTAGIIGEDLTKAGKRAGQDAKDITRGIVTGVENAGRDLTRGVENTLEGTTGTGTNPAARAG